VGIALSIYGSLTKLFNVPLLAVTTSVVASELGKADTSSRRDKLGAACSSALFVALVVGLVEVRTASHCHMPHWIAQRQSMSGSVLHSLSQLERSGNHVHTRCRQLCWV
jgi:hypothetical protein